MEKVRYEIDPHNRLVERLPRFRRVLDGRFKTGGNNTFRVNKEKGRHDILTFDNIWELNKNHELIYRYESPALGIFKDGYIKYEAFLRMLKSRRESAIYAGAGWRW